MAYRSKIVVGVTLIWRKAVAVSKCNSYRPETALFKFGGLKIIRQTAKLNTPPIILRIQYLAYRSKIVVGVTLIWRKAVAVSKCNSYRPETALFKFGGLKIIRQTAKLNTPPIILRIQYIV